MSGSRPGSLPAKKWPGYRGNNGKRRRPVALPRLTGNSKGCTSDCPRIRLPGRRRGNLRRHALELPEVTDPGGDLLLHLAGVVANLRRGCSGGGLRAMTHEEAEAVIASKRRSYQEAWEMTLLDALMEPGANGETPISKAGALRVLRAYLEEFGSRDGRSFEP